ncbi:MAG: NAD(P)-dependent oxidoreductase [Candidatus Zophobacter franzmannii]|nr:NAD(P)-dependent oxidoreductase [Candidatus Zophobacter franzmannii]
MPKQFWQLIEKRGIEEHFEKDNILFSEDIEIFIIRTDILITESYFKRFPNLKLIIRAGSGVDNVDFEAADRYNVKICNTPNANVQSAYEHTISMVMAMLKNHTNAKQALKEKSWKSSLEASYEIADLRALIVGVGRIGTKVAKFLQDNGADVRGVDPYHTDEKWQELGIEKTSYIQGLKWCNLITYHCPLTKLTTHLFSEPILNSLKEPIWLLNVSRGKVVDEVALEKGINSGMLKGVAIDVFEDEPWEPKDFIDKPNVYLTPHTGAYTGKAKARLVEETLDVWQKYVKNNELTSETVRWDKMSD